MDDNTPSVANILDLVRHSALADLLRNNRAARIVSLAVAASVVVGLFNVVTNDGIPSCAKNQNGLSINATLDCSNAIDKWCAENHPENTSDCRVSIEMSGDLRYFNKG